MLGFAKENTRIGFAQVERNHMSGGEAEARIHAQLPADTDVMGTVLENGRFAKYDYINGKVTTEGDFEWEMIYNEEMLYDERLMNHKDFALQAKNYTPNWKAVAAAAGTDTVVPGELVPRLMAVEVGDIFTTNAIGEDKLTVEQISALNEWTVAEAKMPAVGTKLYIAANGYLSETEADGPVFVVVKPFAGRDVEKSTMADMQPAVKLMRIK